MRREHPSPKGEGVHVPETAAGWAGHPGVHLVQVGEANGPPMGAYMRVRRTPAYSAQP